MPELKNIRIAVSGIYQYGQEELPSLGLSVTNAPEKKKIYNVYRPAVVLKDSCELFKMLPLTHHHPRSLVDESNFNDLVIGYTGENPFIDYIADKDEVGIRSTVMLANEEAFKAYERGEVQLSPGYNADFEWQKGTAPDGTEYDIVMKKIKAVNHVALLPNGRGGADAVILDNAMPKKKTIFEKIQGSIFDFVS